VGFSNDRELLRRLIRGGMAGQLTAGSLAGRFGKEVQRFSWWLLEERLVHLVASDAHSVDRRPPGMASPLQAVGLDAAWIEYLVVQTPADLLAGDALGTPPAGPVRAKRLSNLLRRAS
jgi:protein-tyrosine phosphatase